MPKTKFQNFIYSVLMTIFMSYIISVYNISYQKGGLEYVYFLYAFRDMLAFGMFTFAIDYFLIHKIVIKITSRIITPKDSPIVRSLVSSGLTASFLCPSMSLFATFYYNGFTMDWFAIWMTSIVANFTFTLFIQIFCIGPMVRLIFNLLFRNQIDQVYNE